MSQADDDGGDGDDANASSSGDGDGDGDGDRDRGANQPATDHNAGTAANTDTNTDSDLDADSEGGSASQASEQTASPAADRPLRADAVTQAEIDELRRELDALEADLDDRTVHRDEIKNELQQYVRSRVRRGRARGWGPYLVLGYGTVMTVGAFALLNDGWAILAMLIVWLSTLGLYTVMLVTGLTLSVAGAPGRLLERLR